MHPIECRCFTCHPPGERSRRGEQRAAERARRRRLGLCYSCGGEIVRIDDGSSEHRRERQFGAKTVCGQCVRRHPAKYTSTTTWEPR